MVTTNDTIDKIVIGARARLVSANVRHNKRGEAALYVCPSCMFDEERSRFTTTSDPRSCGKCANEGKKELFCDPTDHFLLVGNFWSDRFAVQDDNIREDE